MTKIAERLKGVGDTEIEKEITLEDILIYLLDNEKGINLKTIIYQPDVIALYETYAKHLRDDEKLVKTGKAVLDIITVYKEIMVSLLGQGREGVLKAISSVMGRERELSLKEKVTKNLKEV